MEEQIVEAMAALKGHTVITGLVVDYRGRVMHLLAVNVEHDDAYGPYKWQATATADPVDDGPCDCVGRGMAPMGALDACADEADHMESYDADDDDVDDAESFEDDEESFEDDDADDDGGADASNVFNIIEEEDGP